MAPREDEEVRVIDGEEFTVVRSTAKLRVVPQQDVPVLAIASKGDDGASGQFWQDGNNIDLVWTQFILDTEGENLNWDYMPRPVLMKGFQTAKNKPVNHDHRVKESASLVFANKDYLPAKSTIYGHMTRSALADAEGNLLTEKQIAKLSKKDMFGRPDKDKLTVVAWACMYSFLFPKTVKDVVTYADDGDMHVSMERWVRKYDFLYRDKKGALQAISKQDAIDNGYHEKWKRHEMVNDQPIYRRSLDFTYGGVASTMIPANEMATFIETDDKGVELATAAASNPALKNLLDRHAEVHRLHALSHGAEERMKLEKEHEWIHKCIAEFRR